MRKLMLLTVLVAAARVAQADNGLFYFAAGITSNSANHVEPQGYDNHYFPNINSTSWQVFAGIRPIRLFAV